MQHASREAPRGKGLLGISRLTNKGSLTHRDEQRAVNEFAETGFYKLLHGCRTRSGLIRGNVWLHYSGLSSRQTTVVSSDQQ